MTDFLMGRGYDKWFAELGVTDAPLTRKGLATTLGFFHQYMPTLPRKYRLAFLKAMDLHHPVEVVTLKPGETLTAYRKHTEDPFKTFFTRRGVSPTTIGLDPNPRGYVQYRVKQEAAALESKCAPAWDTWTDDRPQHLRRYYEATGGGSQLIVPDSRNVLKAVRYGERAPVGTRRYEASAR